METSRRDFLKVATIGGAAATVFGFDLEPAYAQLKELKIARAAETRSTCPYCAVGCGVLIYTIGDKRQERHSASDPRRRRSRSSDQPRDAVPQGLFARAGYAQPAAAHEAASPAPRRDRLAGYFLG